MVVDSIVGDVRPSNSLGPDIADIVALARVVPGDWLDVIGLCGCYLGDALAEDGFADAVVELPWEVFVL